MWSPIRIHACRTWARACTHTHVCSLSHKLTTQHWQIFFQNTLNQSKGNANFVYLFSHYTPICCHKCMNLCHIFIVSWHYGLPLHSSSSSDSWAFFNQWYILYTADCSKISLCMNCIEAYKCYHCWFPWSAKQFDFCPLFEHCNQHRQHISLPYPNAAHQLVSTCPILQNLALWPPPCHFNMQHNYLGIPLFWTLFDPPMYSTTKGHTVHAKERVAVSHQVNCTNWTCLHLHGEQYWSKQFTCI